MSAQPAITFDAIHTQEKQAFLAQKMTEVAEQIHAKYAPEGPVLRCPCCGSTAHGFYVEKFHFKMDLCQDCGHIFTNPMPSAEALNHYYNSDLKTFENKFFHESRAARIPIFTDRLTEIQKHVKGRQLLDIGSAVGIFLDANRQLGHPFEITSCDLSEEACTYIAAHYSEVKVLHSDVLDLPEDQRFDCITLWDTLEHIVDPSALLKKLGRLLKPEGILCFSTPNTASFEWQVMGQDHVQLLPPGHVNLYNTRNIHQLMASTGFVIESLRTPNASLDVSYIKKMVTHADCDAQLASLPQAAGRLARLLCAGFFASEAVEAALISHLKQSNMAGNMAVIAKKQERRDGE